jgi:hypothetical protein
MEVTVGDDIVDAMFCSVYQEQDRYVFRARTKKMCESQDGL